jgi:hypothetical protein
MVKIVGTAKYAHKSNLLELVDKCFTDSTDKLLFIQFLQEAMTRIKFDIVKYDKGKVTLISSPDWDIANEPIVGHCYRWEERGWRAISQGQWVNPNITPNYKQIYHNKWMFVANDYKGFNIEQAKKRSELWNSLPDIKEVKSKIGYKKFWQEYLSKYGIAL